MLNILVTKVGLEGPRIRFGSKADICTAMGDVRLYPRKQTSVFDASPAHPPYRFWAVQRDPYLRVAMKAPSYK